MSMKLTYADLRYMAPSLGELLNSKELPGKYRMDVAALGKTVGASLELYNDERNKLIKEFAGDHKNEDGVVAVPEDKVKEFMIADGELLTSEVELQMDKVSLPQSAFPTAADINVLDKITTATK